MTASPTLVRICAAIGLIGSASTVPADVISWFLAADYNPIRQSISALAVGPSSWLIDLGLWCFVAACIAIATGFQAWPAAPRFRWPMLALSLLGADVAIIAQVNQYAGTQNAGADIHAWAVYALGLLFALASLLAAPGLKAVPDGPARFSVTIGIAWVVLCLLYLLVPEGWNGAFERALVAFMLVWLAVMARTIARAYRMGVTI